MAQFKGAIGEAVLGRMGTIQHAAEYGGVPPIPPYGLGRAGYVIPSETFCTVGEINHVWNVRSGNPHSIPHDKT